MRRYINQIVSSVYDNLNNHHGEINHDAGRHGPYALRGKDSIAPFPKRARRFLKKIFGILKCHRLYEALHDEASKKCLIEVLAYRLLGKGKVMLSTNTPQYWQMRQKSQSLADPTDIISVTPGSKWKLSRFHLDAIGYPLTFYSNPYAITTTFLLRHYAYDNSIAPEKGDWVIDAGGCWGDTALFFANEVGESGRVFTFEFIPSNLGILKNNLGLNPRLQDRIRVVEAPLWDESGRVFYCTDEGPSSRISRKRTGTGEIEARTVTIDAFIEQNRIERVDFIKMDIEGAELAALRGAEATIRRHKPKLAISLYHSLPDFWRIPAYLQTLGCRYEYHLAHYTIHAEETVLFAIAR